MSSSVTSFQSHKLAKPQYFTRSKTGKWYCNICSPTTNDDDHPEEERDGDLMTYQAALQHERTSSSHAQNVANTEMWTPRAHSEDWDKGIQPMSLTTEEVKRREDWTYVHRVRDTISFWIKGVEGAERGEVPRMEEFLKSLESGPWGSKENGWEYFSYAYSAHEWGVVEAGSDAEADAGDEWKCQSKDHRSTGIATGQGDSRLRAENRLTRFPNGGRKRKKRARRQQDDAYIFVEDIARRVAADNKRKRRMHAFYELPTAAKITKIEEVIKYLQGGT